MLDDDDDDDDICSVIGSSSSSSSSNRSSICLLNCVCYIWSEFVGVSSADRY